jgi:hypothetical protein
VARGRRFPRKHQNLHRFLDVEISIGVKVAQNESAMADSFRSGHDSSP